MMISQTNREKLMRIAMEEAATAVAEGNDPFGGVLADKDGNLVLRGHNIERTQRDPTAHAEMTLLKKAFRELGTTHLSEYALFCNGEPCSMCMSAIIKAGINEVYFGAHMEPHANPFFRAQEICDRAQTPVSLTNVLKEECTDQLTKLRAKQEENEGI